MSIYNLDSKVLNNYSLLKTLAIFQVLYFFYGLNLLFVFNKLQLLTTLRSFAKECYHPLQICLDKERFQSCIKTFEPLHSINLTLKRLGF